MYHDTMPDLDPTELPPLDEKGLPKYKGKKRGRKPKVKKRKMKADRPKRKHTGYTLFMQETYPNVKVKHPDEPSKELISLVAKQWKDLAMDEKNAWKERAQQATDQSETRGSTNKNDEKIDAAAAAATNNLHQTSTDDHNAEVRDTGNKHQNDSGSGRETATEEHREENGDDDDIDENLADN